MRGLKYATYVLFVSFPQNILRRVYIFASDKVPNYGLFKIFILFISSILILLFIIACILNGAWIYNIVVIFSILTFGIIFRFFIQLFQFKGMLAETVDQIANQRFSNVSHFTSLTDLPINNSDKERIHKLISQSTELEIGIMDRDGRILDLFGALSFFDCVSLEKFIPKDRFKISIVIKDGIILIKKSFENDRFSFIKEAYFLTKLSDKINVPSIRYILPNQNIIYMNLILGKSIQDLLANNGVTIRYSDIVKEPSFKKLSGSEISHIVDKNVKNNIDKFVDFKIFDSIDRQLDIAHKCGIVGIYLKPGNILIEDGTSTAFLIDFHTARIFKNKGFLFNLFRDQDRIKFNTKCGRNLITEKSASNYICHNIREWYAPIDFGYGLTKGAFWWVNSGVGRWKVFIKNYLPDLKDKRVLDLGSNNGCMPLMMLKEGASEIIGMESSKEFFQQSLLVRELFQWRDMQKYAFKAINTDMYDIINSDFGSFDIVTSFCTLYYLNEQQMESIIRRISEISPLVVIQANNLAGSTWDSDKPRRASVEFLKNLLEKNGFPYVDIKSPPFSTRPLLIGNS